MPDKLTKRQTQVLGEIRRFIREQKIAPTVRDLAGRLNVTPSTVHKLLRALREKGHIKLKEGLSRGIILPEPTASGVAIPLLGRIPAGEPTFAEENYEGYMELDSSFVPGGELFALKVKGDSMVGANIMDGDTAVIRKQDDAENGEIVAALVDGEATLKRFKRTGQKIELQPENEDYEPIPVDVEEMPLLILGKLVALVRKF